MKTAPSKLWILVLLAMLALWILLSLRLARVETVILGYNIPKINPCLRRENDCAQIATYIVMANEGCSVGPAAFEQLFTYHKDSGTPVDAWVRTVRRELRAQYHQDGRHSDLVRNLRTGVAPMIVVWIPTAQGRMGHGMVVTGYKSGQWQLADARGKRWVPEDQFADMWSGQWVETGKRS